MVAFFYGGPHPAFSLPAAEERLWRFVGLPQFFAILQRGALHFSRMDKFKDPFEGTLTRPMLEAERRYQRENGQKYLGNFNKKEYQKKFLSWFGACCWYRGHHESEAMWNLHAREGVAIQTTVSRLVTSLPVAPAEHAEVNVLIGTVRYVDYSSEMQVPLFQEGKPSWNNVYVPLMHKRSAFQHEQEVRAVFVLMTPDGESVIPEAGQYVPVDLPTLIEKIHVSPLMPEWFVDVVRTAIEKHGYSFKIERSPLADSPYEDIGQP